MQKCYVNKGPYVKQATSFYKVSQLYIQFRKDIGENVLHKQ